jgi:steroid delta-isomerase-like uncharacterized protein
VPIATAVRTRGKSSHMTETNKDIARKIEEQVLDRGHLEMIPEIFHPDALVHGPIYTIFLLPCRNHDEIREHVVGNRTGFPDLRHTIHGQMAEGDTVITYFTVSGTNDGTFAGSPPTGRMMKGPGISIDRFVDGKVADSWQTCDRTLNFIQLGVVPDDLLPDYAITDPESRPVGTIGGTAERAAENKAVVSRLYDAINAGDTEQIDELIAADAAIEMPGLRGSTRDDYHAFLDETRNALELEHSPDLLIAEGNLVAARVRLTGTHKGDYLGRPASGNAIDLEILQTWRVEDGTITALHALPDWFSLAAQLGPVPEASEAAAEDEAGPIREHPNTRILRRSYDYIASGDILGAYGMFTNDLVWHVPEGHRLAGIYEGRDVVFGILGQLVQMTGGSLQMHVDHVLADDERGVALITSSASRNGQDFVAKEVHLFELENGKIKVFWTLPQVPFPPAYWEGAPVG